MHHHNLLASERAKWALTQADVGALLGLSADAIGNYELDERSPAVAIALGLTIVFGKTLSQLFPDWRCEVATDMVPRAQELSAAVEQQHGPIGRRKQQFLSALGDRLSDIVPSA